MSNSLASPSLPFPHCPPPKKAVRDSWKFVLSEQNILKSAYKAHKIIDVQLIGPENTHCLVFFKPDWHREPGPVVKVALSRVIRDKLRIGNKAYVGFNFSNPRKKFLERFSFPGNTKAGA